MHVVTACDFSVCYPNSKKIKPVPGRQFSIIYTRELVNSIVKSVDRFYKPNISCRRHFNIYPPFVTKYYPNCISNKKKQRSFLHKDHNEVIMRDRPMYKKYRSMIEFSYKQYFQNNQYIIQICHDFLISERYLCNLQKYNSLNIKEKESFSKYTHGLNLAHLDLSDVKKRQRQTGAGFRNSFRKSFPLMSTVRDTVSLI